MQVTETILARVACFGNVRLLNPEGLSLQVIHSGLLDRYKFLIPPTEFDFTKGIRYSDGEFLYNGKPRAVALMLFSDGWTIETLVSTDAAEAFLDDVSDWMITIGFRSANELVARKMYESQLVLRADMDLAKSFDNFRGLVKLIAELASNPTEQVSGIYIGSDSAMLSTFTFERRQGVPFSENIYFSRAALPTSLHLRALEEIEKILA